MSLQMIESEREWHGQQVHVIEMFDLDGNTNFNALREWCEEHFPRRFDAQDGYYSAIYMFKDQNDALMFKMRWF